MIEAVSPLGKLFFTVLNQMRGRVIYFAFQICFRYAYHLCTVYRCNPHFTQFCCVPLQISSCSGPQLVVIAAYPANHI